ncbi:hypothetical protein ACWEQL_00190 [Kitasatospora sp. NPDC004240]
MIDFEVLTTSARREGIERFGVGVVVRDRSGRVLPATSFPCAPRPVPFGDPIR